MPHVIDLNHYRREREAAARATPLYLAHEIDEDNPNRTTVYIASKSAASVQGEINFLVAYVESFGNGAATFDMPRRLDNYYFAEGEIVVFPEVDERSLMP
jgi:hypothetical protein